MIQEFVKLAGGRLMVLRVDQDNVGSLGEEEYRLVMDLLALIRAYGERRRAETVAGEVAQPVEVGT